MSNVWKSMAELFVGDEEGGHEADRSISSGVVVQLAAGRVDVGLGALVALSIH